MSNEATIEQAIQAKGLTAPRLTPADIDAAIVGETFTVLPSGKVMVCELTLRNGFTVRGEAATVSKANFNEEIGRKISRDNARGKVWELEGYLLQQRLADEARLDAIVTAVESRITFAEFVEYGKANGGNIVNGMPWSFKYQGQPVTHETDTCYLIAPDLRFERGDLLLTDESGALRVLKGADTTGLQPHQKRVVAEKAELDERLEKLTKFFATDTFAGLDSAERERLTAQCAAMCDYSNCLSERIDAFTATA